jgi:hypothetical protein
MAQLAKGRLRHGQWLKAFPQKAGSAFGRIFSIC